MFLRSCLASPRRFLLFILFGLGFSHAPAAAQNVPGGFQVQQLRPWLDIDGMYQTQSGRTLGQWNYQIAALFDYAKDPLILRTATARGDSLIGHQVGAQIALGIGFLSWLDLYISIPMTIFQSGKIPDNDAFGTLRGQDLSGFVFSDIKAALKVQALREDRHFVNLAALIQASFPTNSPGNRFGGEDGVGFGLTLMLSKQLSILHLALNLGYSYGPRSEFLNLIVEHGLSYGLGARLTVLQDRLDIIADISGTAYLSGKTSVETAPLDIYIGARIYPLSTPDLGIDVGFGLPFTPGLGSPQFRVFLGVNWSKKVRDKDGDGLADNIDQCPDVPGPKENNGCPDKDTDGDGIIDRLDKCPTVAGPKENNGCPWGDKDGDGLTDNIDKCPDQAGPKENQGCPDKDTDGDGIVDRLDKCPEKPGPKENEGCPWGDKDGDGLTDNVDKCPDVPGPKENEGCPDKDRDGDGVVDRLDKCPDVPGLKENNGCPKVVLVEVTDKEIKILQKIFFALNSDKIQKRSFGILDQVVSVLKSRDKVRIRIEGHTDTSGNAKYNRGLSKRRAASVRRYLIGKGIEEGRLESEGYGPDKPLFPNTNKANREKNRRVEFNIISQ